MDIVNQKIIDAIIAKADKVCPGSLALIGIYGSVATGDAYGKSDLDLLLLIENENGRKLGTGFILDDRKVGYDIYCTDWDGLRYDAECNHAHLSKLMDSQIVYIKNEEVSSKLLQLRAQAKQVLESETRFQRAAQLAAKAKICYANACLYETLGEVRLEAFGVIHYLLDAIMLYHGKYFKRGVKRTFEELAMLPVDDLFKDTILKVAGSKEVPELRTFLKSLILYAEDHMRQEKTKAEPSENLAGTYEEMYSNWRNKVEEAAEKDNLFASFMNLCNLQFMLLHLSDQVEIGDFRILDEFSPDHLAENIRTVDAYLQKYEQIYEQAGIRVNRFADVDAFAESYLRE